MFGNTEISYIFVSTKKQKHRNKNTETMNLEVTEQELQSILRVLGRDIDRQKKIVESQSGISNVESGRSKSIKTNTSLMLKIFKKLDENNLI